MKKLTGAISASVIVLLAAAASQAQAQDVDVSFNIGATTDYVFRGISQTDENPAIQGGVDLTSGIFYGGVWASNVDFGDSTDAEIDVYAGFKPTVGKVGLDFGVIGYFYTNAPSAADWDYVEFKAAASLPVTDKATLGAAVFYSPEFTGGTGTGVYAEVNGAYKFNDQWSVSAALGNQDVENAGDYTTWNAGVSFAPTSHISLDVRYWDTDEHSFGPLFESRVVASIKGVF